MQLSAGGSCASAAQSAHTEEKRPHGHGIKVGDIDATMRNQRKLNFTIEHRHKSSFILHMSVVSPALLRSLGPLQLSHQLAYPCATHLALGQNRDFILG